MSAHPQPGERVTVTTLDPPRDGVVVSGLIGADLPSIIGDGLAVVVRLDGHDMDEVYDVRALRPVDAVTLPAP